MTWPPNQHPPQYGWEHPPQGGAPAPNRPGNGGLSPIMIAVLAIVLVAVLIIAVAVVAITLRRDAEQAAPAPVESSAPQEREEAPPEPSTAASPTDLPGRPPLHEGWQVAHAVKWGLVYDIPADDGWEFDGPEYIRGYEDDDGTPVIAMSGTSTYRDEPCETWGSRADLGAQGVSDSDDTAGMAEAVALNWAGHAFETDEGAPETSVRSVEEFSRNGLEGHHAVIDVGVRQEDTRCQPPSGVVHALAAPHGDGGVRVFVIVADTGIEGAADADTVDGIVATLRDTGYQPDEA
ncbi:hypothetical protein [Marinitenerispora sediminis]|uniref:DUF8017 domain-containing protein n=1 Tax=Marinitenerispora sediminis TaxID=1931232 RepID=A0A368T793_9ACTN|nr:hypothetical protein [Marinitenerispora sediminis]RCV52306.1 hypothetical protein DEF28_13355 [Marinitenerispora sediminis]RCV58846.1 hypothetical protein DEF23_08230 [Marinitenerispora sediminis]RCV59364.1 hypothetical protein DEF24_09830 [Marinitenerispora sediminis]